MYKKVILENSIPVVLETTKETSSVCIGIWVKVGSRNEIIKKNGISHFLEHMFFKGTAKRTARDIAVEIDSLGGELNAFTSKESTAFYIRVLDEHLEKGVELLTDIFLNSIFPEDEIEKEKGVIFEEIKLVADTPDDYIHDLFNKNIWGESRMGQSVLGSKETIASFTKDELLNYVKNHYGPNNIVIACSGHLEEESLIGRLNCSFGTLKGASITWKEPCPEFKCGLNIITKKLAEVHLCLGVKGLPHGSEDRYSMHLLNTILGSGISSRLFQEVREKRGLAYSIGSFNVSYFDTGVWTVYAGTDKKRVNEVVNIIIDQMRELSSSITGDELQRSKNQLKGNIVLALESTNSKMVNIARQEMYYGRYFTPEDIIKAVESVTLEELKELSHRLLGNNAFALTVYGPVREMELQELQQNIFNPKT
ncbi:MAG: insulinase family protein [Candidatus Mariimomonas ferrooxydans]